jgi:predicted ABC-type ATPase
MTDNNKPVCYVIGGPNGAGKTTFAMRYLPRIAACTRFVNADMIAQGPLSVDTERVIFRSTCGKSR